MSVRLSRDEMLDYVSTRGVQPSFFDAFDIERQIPENTLEWLYELFLAQTDTLPPIIATPGRWHPDLQGPITLGDGREMVVEGILPIDAVGYHALHLANGQTQLVLGAPEKLATPPRSFGWSVQLYAARTERSWGIGDFSDLAQLSKIAGHNGAGFVLTCPLHAGNMGQDPLASPYSPTSREWLQVLYIAIDKIATTAQLDDLRQRGLELNDERIINRSKVWEIKKEALLRIWEANGRTGGKDCEEWVAHRGQGLRNFAAFMALSEELGLPWQTWDQKWQRPEGLAVQAWIASNPEEIAFHSWLQYLCDQQLGEASRQGVELVADIAVGFDGGGFDAWSWQDILVFDAEVGCPPDRHNRDGQRWGLPAFSPTGLGAVGYLPFIHMVRSALIHSKALRIDHVMQLWRLFWVPQAGGPSEGAYVRYPADALLAIVRIEASRNGAWAVGEDMGTVPEYIRPVMEDIDMLGYRAACRVPTSMFTINTMGATGTHDHATIAGILLGTDPLDMERIGKSVDWDAEHNKQRDLALEAGLPLEGPYTQEQVHQAVLARCASVANSASRVVVFNLEDAAAVAERPNMPGTIDQWPNWCLSLPQPADLVLKGELAQSITQEALRTRLLFTDYH